MLLGRNQYKVLTMDMIDKVLRLGHPDSQVKPK